MTTYSFYDAEHDRLFRRVDRAWKSFASAQETMRTAGVINRRRDAYKEAARELEAFYVEHGRPKTDEGS